MKSRSLQEKNEIILFLINDSAVLSPHKNEFIVYYLSSRAYIFFS